MRYAPSRRVPLWLPTSLGISLLLLSALPTLAPQPAKAEVAPPSSATEEYPTTCQWNNCPRPGDATCLVAWNGHYICTEPYIV
jgi:hypothetical protein